MQQRHYSDGVALQCRSRGVGMNQRTKTASRFGPGILVAAAFIGPGTITTASIAGAQFGFALLWALLFSALATFLLQEMTARLALVTRQGLAEALRATYRGTWLGTAAVILVVAAVGIGNAAYQTGNITGAAMGLELSLIHISEPTRPY